LGSDNIFIPFAGTKAVHNLALWLGEILTVTGRLMDFLRRVNFLHARILLIGAALDRVGRASIGLHDDMVYVARH
jgi:hypothetical protein